ncbi:hypothetical protein VKT23_007306, partial [Stygiomarasmius scandens]
AIPETINGPDLMSFDEITQEIIDDNNQEDEPEEQEHEVLETTYLLKNLFRYPSSASPQPASLSFMMDHWARGKAAMEADVQLHEILSVSQECNDAINDSDL